MGNVTSFTNPILVLYLVYGIHSIFSKTHQKEEVKIKSCVIRYICSRSFMSSNLPI